MISQRQCIVFGVLMGVILLPGILQIVQMPANLDMLWLCEALMRIFAGGTMSTVAYEINPPLSMLIYTIPVLLQNFLSVPLTVSAHLQSFGILAFGMIVFWKVLADFPGLLQVHRVVLVAAYLTANIFFAGYYFGERDHLIGMVAVPLVFLQISLMRRTHSSTLLTLAFLALAAMLFLLKPHFGLIPLAFFAARIFIQRDGSLLKSPDFISFIGVTLLYTAVILLFFRDYLTVILPDVWTYYSIYDMRPMMMQQYKFEFIGVLVLGASTFLSKNPEVKAIGRWLSLAALLCYGAAVLQNKGFPYHFLPGRIFLTVGAALILFELSSFFLKKPLLALYLSIGVMVTASYAHAFIYNQSDPRYYDPTSPVVAEILAATSGEQPKSFYLQSLGMGGLHEIAYHYHLTYASRFAVPFLFQGLIQSQRKLEQGLMSPDEEIKFEADYERVGTMVAEDFDRYQPGVVILMSPKMSSLTINLPTFFARHQRFQKTWADYKYSHQIEEPIMDSFGNPASTRIFDVYRRVE